MNNTPAAITYASVVTRQDIHIALVLVACDDLKDKCKDIMNTYTTTPCSEMILTVLTTKFGEDQGKYVIFLGHCVN